MILDNIYQTIKTNKKNEIKEIKSEKKKIQSKNNKKYYKSFYRQPSVYKVIIKQKEDQLEKLLDIQEFYEAEKIKKEIKKLKNQEKEDKIREKLKKFDNQIKRQLKNKSIIQNSQ